MNVVVDNLVEQEFERITERFKEESIKEWDESSGTMCFPLFIRVEVNRKWLWHSLLN